MANLVEIDLDNSVVIPLPDGMKSVFLETIALGTGWTAQKQVTETKEELFDTQVLAEAFINEFDATKQFIRAELNTDTSKIKVTYLLITQVDNISKEKWGLNEYAKSSKNFLIEMQKKVNLQQINQLAQEQYEAGSQQIKTTINKSFDGVELQ